MNNIKTKLISDPKLAARCERAIVICCHFSIMRQKELGLLAAAKEGENL